jgi:serine phosphatase RsbU (regulator of sigma subunit)
LPKDIVSGDFLWYQEVDGKVYMAVGDCTGHGIPGALMSMVGSSALDFALTQGRRTPSEILDALDLIVHRNFSQNRGSYEAMDISLCCFDPVKEELTYAGAMRPLVIFSEGKLKKYKGEKRSIGSHKKIGFTDVAVPIKKGDRIYMFSDGYSDQFGGVNGKKYMSKRFEKFIQNIQGHSLEEQQFLFKYEFHHWKSEEFQVDDVLVAAFEIPDAEVERLRA